MVIKLIKEQLQAFGETQFGNALFQGGPNLLSFLCNQAHEFPSLLEIFEGELSMDSIPAGYLLPVGNLFLKSALTLLSNKLCTRKVAHLGSLCKKKGDAAFF